MSATPICIAAAVAALAGCDRWRGKVERAEVGIALTQIHGPADWLALMRRTAKVAGPAWPGFARVEFAQGYGAKALVAAAYAGHSTEGAVIRDVSRGLPAGELDDLYFVARTNRACFDELIQMSPGELAKDLPPPEHAFWERIRSESSLIDPGSYEKVAHRLSGLFLAKDAAGLHAFMGDPSQMRMQRMLAGYYLVRLGDASGFSLFEDMSGMPPMDRSAALETLKELRREAPAALRPRVDALLARAGGK